MVGLIFAHAALDALRGALRGRRLPGMDPTLDYDLVIARDGVPYLNVGPRAEPDYRQKCIDLLVGEGRRESDAVAYVEKIYDALATSDYRLSAPRMRRNRRGRNPRA